MNQHPTVSLCMSLCVRQGWFPALIKSTAALFACGVIIGFRFLPYEMKRLEETPDQRIIYCASSADNPCIVACVRSAKTHGLGDARERWTHQLCLVSDRLDVQRIELPSDLQCLTLHGTRLFVADFLGRVSVSGIATKEMKQLGSILKGRVVSMNCSPDGKTLLVHDSHSLTAWNVDPTSTTCLSPRWSCIDKTIECVAFYQDSSGGVFIRQSQGTWVLTEFESECGRCRDMMVDAGQPAKLSLSRDGRYLAVCQTEGSVALFERCSNDHQWMRMTIPGLCATRTSIATFSVDSRSLITSSSDGRSLVEWDLRSNAEPVTFGRQDDTILGCEWLNDDTLVTWGANNVLRIASLKSLAIASEIEL